MAGDQRTELELFTSFFHQDFNLVGEDAYDVARRHFAGISVARRAALKSELVGLLEFRKSKQALRNAWRRLGAQNWQKGLDLRTALNDFADML